MNFKLSTSLLKRVICSHNSSEPYKLITEKNRLMIDLNKVSRSISNLGGKKTNLQLSETVKMNQFSSSCQ
jgi:hypothetical protein